MSTSHPDDKADDRRYVELGPGVIALLLGGKQVEDGLLFPYGERRWAQLVRHLRRADDPQARFDRLTELGKVTEEQLADVEEAARAIRRGAELPPLSHARPLVHANVLLSDTRPIPPDVIDSVLPGEALTVASGDAGVGKSYVILHMALCVAAGIEWLGLPVDQRPVLVIDYENRPLRLRERLRSLSHLVGGEQEMGKLPIFIHTMPMSHELDEDEFSAELMYVIKETGAGLVVIDSLADFLGTTDENDDAAMARIALRLRAIVETTGATVVVIHHVAQSGAGKSSQTARGASSLVARVDVAIDVRREGEVVTIRHGKNRDGEPITLRMAGTFTETDFTLERLEAKEPPSDAITAAIRDYIKDGKGHRSRQLVAELEEHGVAKSSTIHKRLRRMADNGEIVTDPPPEQRQPRQAYQLRLRQEHRWRTGDG